MREKKRGAKAPLFHGGCHRKRFRSELQGPGRWEPEVQPRFKMRKQATQRVEYVAKLAGQSLCNSLA